jgi:rhamnose transport system ATP-binding protein
MSPRDDPILEVRGVSKSFGVVQALRGVDLALYPGQVHALIGENGAGKSTLTKILGGDLQPDSGEVRDSGMPVTLASPVAALKRGITVIHQELNLTPQMTVAENIWLGHEPVNRIGRLNRSEMRTQAAAHLRRLGAEFRVDRRVEGLSTADQQLVEIAAALNRRSRTIIMDEPTASLSEESTHRLFSVIRSLRDDGVSVVYISHELDHVFELSDQITVLKDGARVACLQARDTSMDEVITMMVGRSLGDLFPPRKRVVTSDSTPVLEVENLSVAGYFDDVSFAVSAGEVVGLAGLIGAGRTEVALSIFGTAPGVGGSHALRGSVRVKGVPVRLRSPTAAIAAGIAYLPEERKTDGVALGLSITDNIVLPQLTRLSRLGFTSPRAETDVALAQVKALSLRCSSASQRAEQLSGGNQQKVVLGKWLAHGCALLILDDPTRGVDVGAKLEIYRLIRELVEQSHLAVLLISSELPEILGLSDRVLIMRKGRIVGERAYGETSEEDLVRSAFGASHEELS